MLILFQKYNFYLMLYLYDVTVYLTPYIFRRKQPKNVKQQKKTYRKEKPSNNLIIWELCKNK